MLPALSREVGSGFGALHGINALVLMGVAIAAGRPRLRCAVGDGRRPRHPSPPDAWPSRAPAAAVAGRGRHGRAPAAARVVLAAEPGARHLRHRRDGRAPTGAAGPSTSTPGWTGWTGTPVADLTAPPDLPADVSETLTVRAEDGGYTVNGTSPGPLLEATEGDLVEVTLVNDNVDRRHHPALARRRRAERRRRGRGRDPGRRAARARSSSTASSPTRSARSGTTRTRSRTSRCRAACSAGWSSTREQPDPDVLDAGRDRAPLRRRPVAQRQAGHHHPRRAARPGGPAAGDQHRQRHHLGVGDRHGLPGAGGRRHRRQRARRRSTARRCGSPPEAASTWASWSRRAARGSTSGAPRRWCWARTPPPTRPRQPRDVLDLLSYGAPADLGFDPTHADRTFDYSIGKRPGFLDGRPGLWWTINGKLFPDVPMYMVSEGDVVAFTHREQQRRHPPDAPARPPRRRARQGRRGRHRQPVVGGLARGRRRGELRDRVRGRQPGTLDGPLPQPDATPPRGSSRT